MTNEYPGTVRDTERNNTFSIFSNRGFLFVTT